MSPADAVSCFESGKALPFMPFNHRAHVRLCWCYLQQMSLLEVLERLPAGLRRYASVIGLPHKYHETVTWAWIFAVHERVTANPRADWEVFANANTELFGPLLDQWYRPETLASDRARTSFVMPDRSRNQPTREAIA